MKAEQKRAVIMGATSGMGREIALILLQKGWKVGVAGRRRELLEEIKAKAPELVVFEVIDVTKKDAPELLEKLIDALGGMDLYLYSSGYGRLNTSLNLDIELDTIDTNVTGFVTTINYAFNFFRQQQYGHIAAISSVAGCRGIGLNASYSATKRFQMSYLSSLTQLSNNMKYNISVTEILPGFVKTEFVRYAYPMQMEVSYVARKIVNGLLKKKRKIVIDWRYRLVIGVWHLIPRFLWERINLARFVK